MSAANEFWILDCGFSIGGIAALYLFVKPAGYPKSQIQNPKYKRMINE